jgi:hypothetical protein
MHAVPEQGKAQAEVMEQQAEGVGTRPLQLPDVLANV